MSLIPRPGDFGLTRGGGAAMAAVRWGTGVQRFRYGRFIRVPAEFGHAAYVKQYNPVLSPNAPVEIIEAAPGGVRLRWVELDHFAWSTGGPLDVQLTDTRRDQIVRLSIGALHTAYDWPSIAEFIPRFFEGQFTGRFAAKKDGTLFCSEMVVLFGRRAGLDYSAVIPDAVAAGAIAPETLKPLLGPR